MAITDKPTKEPLDSNGFVDVMYVSILRHYNDGRPTEYVKGWSKQAGAATKKKTPPRGPSIVEDGEIIL